MTNQCPVCNQSRSVWFQAEILGKYWVDYLYCKFCGLLQTESPYWLEESYQSPIAIADTGIVQRNLITAEKLACIVTLLLNRTATYVDIGGGYGLLVRLMRDMGFDFYWFDPYCDNVFARGFEATATDQPIRGITAFEVLEHVYDPREFLRQALTKFSTATIVLSTELFAGEPPLPNQWHYYALESGQHISFYQRRTLRYLAEQLSLQCYSYRNFHILTDRRVPFWVFRLTISKLSALLYRLLVQPRMHTKLFTDAEALTAATISHIS